MVFHKTLDIQPSPFLFGLEIPSHVLRPGQKNRQRQAVRPVRVVCTLSVLKAQRPHEENCTSTFPNRLTRFLMLNSAKVDVSDRGADRSEVLEYYMMVDFSASAAFYWSIGRQCSKQKEGIHPTRTE